MSVEENKEFARHYIEEQLLELLRGNVEHVHDFLADDLVDHTLLTSARSDAQAVHDDIAAYRAALTDIDLKVDFMIGEGDLVGGHWQAQGRHHQTFSHREGDIAPTGEVLEVGGLFLYRIRDGKIAETWVYSNLMEALRAGAPV